MAEAATSASERAPLLVASIDFGTTYSGCAFSFRSEFDKNPCTVSCVSFKYGEEQGDQATRVPTCILFSPDQQFHSFGFDAQKHYAEVSEKDGNEASRWYFFKHFKMELQSKETSLGRDLDLLDQTKKKSMKALDVIAEAIRCLKDLLLREVPKTSTFVKATDTVWVLTVPAIWNDAAKQFMREAAVQAGIKADRLRLALEPEAAATFCHYHFLSKKEVFAQTGKRFMTVDCGGGTVEISVFEVAEQGKLKQLHKPHGAACGGTKVDDAFWRLLYEILGREATPSTDNMEMVELMQNLEQAKSQMGKSKRVEVDLPERLKEAVGSQLDNSTLGSKIGRMGSKIRLPRHSYITFFEESKEGIIKAMKEVLSSRDVGSVDAILLVGGLAKSTVIQKAIKEAFRDRRVLVPPSPDLTVLMGAVQFGHCPQATYIYGVSTAHMSRPANDTSKVETVDGVERTKEKATRSSAWGQAPLLVASIDFGTTYSGCAFSFRSDFKSKPCSVNCVNVKFTRDGKEFQAERVPTCILFSPQGEFDSFGFEAQLKYSEMVAEQNEEVDQWYFFDRFKMELREREEEDLTRDLDFLDQIEKKSMKALDVIAEAIRYLKNLLLRELQKGSSYLEASDIVWVLTVPAIWDDAARQFMREAAVKAGIETEKLMLALEPEGASIFCHYQTMEGRESFTEKGKRFMVVDCGGGTVDISVFRDVGDGTLIQEHKPHGAHCGGTKVDEAFENLLQNILGMKGLASINNKELVELMRNFEMAKEEMNTNGFVWVRIPNTLEKALKKHLATSKYKSKLELTKSNLRLPREIFEAFFEESKEGIIEAMNEVLANEDVSSINVILLLGGLAKSTIIQDAVKAAFPDRRVLVPPSPDLTVLKGAVQFGHCPEVIATRVSPYTYGISTTYVSRPGDDPRKVETIDGVKRTKDIFEVLIKINERVSIDEEKKPFEFKPTHTDQKKMKLNLYRTLSPDPKYVTDAGCQKVASIEVDMPDTTGDKKRRVQVFVSVSGTELRVVAKDKTTGNKFSAKCDFLENKAKS